MIRAKVYCSSVTENRREDGTKYSESVSFHAVYSEDPNSENRWFAQATPALSLSQQIDNPSAWGKFVQGKEYYLDFVTVGATPAEVPAPKKK